LPSGQHLSALKFKIRNFRNFYSITRESFKIGRVLAAGSDNCYLDKERAAYEREKSHNSMKKKMNLEDYNLNFLGVDA